MRPRDWRMVSVLSREWPCREPVEVDAGERLAGSLNRLQDLSDRAQALMRKLTHLPETEVEDITAAFHVTLSLMEKRCRKSEPPTLQSLSGEVTHPKAVVQQQIRKFQPAKTKKRHRQPKPSLERKEDILDALLDRTRELDTLQETSEPL